MSQSLRESRLARLQRERDDLASLQTRLARAERDQQVALRAHELATHALRERIRELDALRARDRAIRQDIEVLQSVYLHDFIQQFPVEILQHIFEYVVCDFPDEECGTFAHNTARVSAPFLLSAVCTTWRTVALRHSKLWSYISAGQEVSHLLTHADRIGLQLERSQNAPLDISLTFARDWTISLEEKLILGRVASHVQRWRNVEITLPDDANDNDTFQVLRGPLPLLERLSIMDDNGETERDEPFDDDDYFPFAPRLRVLSLWGPNSIVPRTTSPGFAQLKILRLWYQPAFPHAWKLVELVAPTLESLVLAYNDDHLRLLDPSTFVLFPNLTYLGICGATVLMPHLLAMRMPRLSHLCIETEDPPPQWGTFLEGVAQTVTALTLTGYVDMNSAHLFAALDKVERLAFGRFAAEHGEEYIVARSFFETRTVWVTMRLWPRLASVVFTSRGSIALGTTGTILPFVRWRTTEIEQTDDGERPSRLKECRFELEEAKLPPQWMLAEVKRLLNTA